jgi:hypothetical protein
MKACFWGDQALAFDQLNTADDSINTISCRQIRIVRFAGITFNQSEESTIQFNPKTKRSFKIANWYS